MEQKEHVNKWGLTGDPEIDRQRKTTMVKRINKMREAFEAGHHQQIDLLAGFGGTVAPVKSKSKRTSTFKKDQDTIMKALALDLAEYIPEDMAQYYGFTTRPESAENPRVTVEDDGEAPF